MTSYLSKVAHFDIPYLQLASLLNFVESFGVRKLESLGVACVILRLAVFIQYRHVTDG